jgi:hypothetical protein
MRLVSITNVAAGTRIQTPTTTYAHRSTMRAVIDALCIEYGSTLAGRMQAVARWLNKERLVPVYVNQECILILTASIRRYECIAFNYYALKELQDHKEIQAFLSTNKGKKSLNDCRWISEKMGQECDIMGYLKGTFADEQTDHK